MVNFFILDSKKNEISPIERCVKEVAAKLTDDQWNIASFEQFSMFKDYLEGHPLVDMGCYDITESDALEELIHIRKEYEQALMILIVEASISPIKYLKPGIRPDSILIRPLSGGMVKEVIGAIVSNFEERQSSVDLSKVYVIESKEGKITIPYKDIYYFEAKEKKVYLRTLNDEYGFYETIDQIETSCPETFMRCHRSFIVNTTKIRKIMLSQNLMELTDGMSVPLSRSYKADFKIIGKS